MSRLAAINSTCLSPERPWLAPRDRRRTATWAAGPVTDVIWLVEVWRSVTVEHPMLGEVEVDRGESCDDDQQQPGHGGGVAHLELDEPSLVQVQGVEHRGVRRTTGPVRDDVGLREGLEGADDLQHQVEEDDRREQWQGDLPELSPLACAVDRGRLVVHPGNLPEAGQEDHHGRAERP